MALKVSEIELEKRVRSFESCTISKIWYQQMEEGTDNYQMKDFHSVDVAIYFETENNKIFRIYWADELGIYHGFGVSIKEIAVIDKDDGIFMDVSNDNNWKAMLGKRIISTQIHWQNIIDNMRSGLVPVLGMGYLRRRDYPQTLEIKLEDGLQFYISVLKITDNNKCIPFTNHLSIFFQKDIIDQYYKPLRKW
jgi:hypothetical protein